MQTTSSVRNGTRIPCNIPVTIASVEPANCFSERSVVILVNPQGCAARFARQLEVGAVVFLKGLPAAKMVAARVVNCIRIAENLWLLGLALDEPGNVWGIESPPDDWDAR